MGLIQIFVEFFKLTFYNHEPARVLRTLFNDVQSMKAGGFSVKNFPSDSSKLLKIPYSYSKVFFYPIMPGCIILSKTNNLKQ